MVYTRLTITGTLPGIVRQTSKLIYLDLRQNKKNCVFICLNISTTKETIKPTPTLAHSGGIASTEMLWQPLIIKTNSSMTSKSLSRISSGNYKRT